MIVISPFILLQVVPDLLFQISGGQTFGDSLFGDHRPDSMSSRYTPMGSLPDPDEVGKPKNCCMQSNCGHLISYSYLVPK